MYRTSVQLGYKPDGRPLKKYLSASTIKELEQKVYEARNDLANGLVVSDSTTFGEYSTNWLNIYKANKDIMTKNMYMRILKLTDSIKNIPLKKINRLMIQQIINDNAEHPRTCEQIKLTIKQVFKSAQEDGLVVKNPCIELELPRHVPQEKRALTDEEKQKLRSAILQPQERLLLLLLYGTGCRPAEAYALTKSDFDFKKGTVSITKSAKFDNNTFCCIAAPKTNASIRSVIVSESIMRSIKHILDKIPDDNIFAGPTGKIMNRGYYDNLFEHILKKSGLYKSGVSAYTFRHNFCTECWYAGISIKKCQEQMGHSSYKMVLEVYSHLDESKENTRSKMASMVM